MIAPTFTFTVVGFTHDEVMAEADRIAKAYWAGRLFDIVEVSSHRYSDGERSSSITTKQCMVAGGVPRQMLANMKAAK